MAKTWREYARKINPFSSSDKSAAAAAVAAEHPLAKKHALAFLLHLGQAIATGVLAGVLDERYDKDVLFKRDKLFSVPVAALIPAFFGISALGHLYAWRRDDLFKRVCRLKCWQRWAEYALSASIMTLCIALLCTVDQVVVLGGFVVITVLVMAAGYKAESDIAAIVHKKTSNYTAEDAKADSKPSELFWGAAILEGVVWAFIIAYYINHVGSVPWFVHAIVGVLFVCYSAYPVLFALYQQRVIELKRLGTANTALVDPEPIKSAWKAKYQQNDQLIHTQAVQAYEWAEFWYLILSLVAKTSLGWLVFWGAIKAQ